MRFRFVHAADIHLGYEQYNLAARLNDFARAYLEMVRHAIEVRADFVLIAGDLFHRANADAWTLKQATVGLTRLREAGIPVVAVEGNHDAQHHHKQLSWLEYLCDQELLHLLNVQQASNGFRSLAPFDETARRGSWIELAGARIYGIKYYGALTARILEELHEQIEPAGYTILMLHAGLEGQVPGMHGGLTHGQIEPLHGRVDYLALGHIHKRLIDDYDWVFNPGSAETNSMEEMDWPHGFFDVQVDTGSPRKHEVRPVETPSLRPFRRISVSAEGCSSLDEFVARADEKIATQRGVPERAVIELHLGGSAEFRRQDVPVEQLKGAVELAFNPLVARVRNALSLPGIVSVRKREGMSQAELERTIVEQLVAQQAEYRDIAPEWARLIVEIKNMAVEKDVPASIVDHIRGALERMRPAAGEPPLDTSDDGAVVALGGPAGSV